MKIATGPQQDFAPGQEYPAANRNRTRTGPCKGALRPVPLQDEGASAIGQNPSEAVRMRIGEPKPAFKATDDRPERCRVLAASIAGVMVASAMTRQAPAHRDEHSRGAGQ